MAGLHAPLRILADDLTGALDSAAAFGAGVPVHLGQVPPSDADAVAPPVAVLATATRDVAPAALPALLAPAIGWLAAATGGLAFKKVDSLLRGNTFDEVDQVARGAGFDRVLFAPAFPAQGRVTIGGWQRVLRAAGADEPVGGASIPAAMTRRGWAVTDTLPAPDAGPTVWVPDVRNADDLRRVTASMRDAAATGARWLWVGSAGLAQALAEVRAASESAASTEPTTEPHDSGPVWLVSASHHPVSRAQWARLAASRPALPRLQGGDAAAVEALLRTHAADCGGPGDRPDAAPLLLDLAPAGAIDAGTAATLLAAQIAALVAAGRRPGTLVVVGGDTLLALCHAAGAHTLHSAATLARPGWGSARLVGGPWHGTRCHSRSGAFGGPDDLLEVLHTLGA